MTIGLRLQPKLITVDRSAFQMSLWKMTGGRYHLKETFQIAVGQVGYETPVGMYFVEGKSTTPDWRAPYSPWVPEEDRGVLFPIDDPKNPFAGGFISIGDTDGVGFHGTKFDPKLGQAVSHGCIRMAVEDFNRLYDRVPQGTPVFIHD